MKTNLLLLCVALLAGCQSKEETEFDKIARIFHIYECQDGTYDLQTPIQKLGKFHTLQEARQAKTNHTVAHLQAEKRGDFDFEKRVEKCGRRVE